MASPYQQQVFRRKLIYIALILVLFTGAWLWRRNVVDVQARELAVREESRGEVELTGAALRLGLTGLRGVVVCMMWNTAREMQMKNELSELEVVVRSLAKLQPHFITPWLFQSWNLAYNVYAEVDRPADKFFYMTRGVELLGEGERQNRYHPDIRWSIGFYTQHKVCQSDETNVQRSIFQLSLIPPNERDPARFWKTEGSRVVLNWAELEDFCRKHPQLVRRLRQGMMRETVREKRRQFTCEKPEDLVQFLEDNFQVPGLYRVVPPPGDVPAHARVWDRNHKDVMLPAGERFPILPPPHTGAFDDSALTYDSQLRDDTDGFTVAHAWYSYAQEPLPAADELPGSNQEITDRTRQRRPKHMTTLLFRNYPAQGCRYMAERLEQEGWFDDEPYDASDWFEDSRQPRTVQIGGGRKWAVEAWQRAARAWQHHGEANHLLFRSAADEQRMHDLALRYWRRQLFGGRQDLKKDEQERLEGALGMIPPGREEDLDGEQRREMHAARYIFEYNFYRTLSNFLHHHTRARTEAQEATVAARKLFFTADAYNLAGSRPKALKAYRDPVKVPAWGERAYSPLEAWRDLVLKPNKDFRRDTFTQEGTAEIQIRYLDLYDGLDGREVKEALAKASRLVPLLPRTDPALFRSPIVQGPFDVVDEEGVPYVDPQTMQGVLQRMGRIVRKPTDMRPPTPRPPRPGT
jgi:hypothetical protein